MKLSQIIQQYITFKKSMGLGFQTPSYILNAFLKRIGDVEMESIESTIVELFILGKDKNVTKTCNLKYSILNNFYKYSLGRGYVKYSPLPKKPLKKPSIFQPYIYTKDEIKRLLNAADDFENPRKLLQSRTMRTLVLLLYGAALRISEAISLRVSDMDLSENILIIRESKFYKDRIVPIDPSLSIEFASYKRWISRIKSVANIEKDYFLVTRTGSQIPLRTTQESFRHLCKLANIFRNDGSRFQPRLHDLRHTAAVHRIVAWYREGQNVQHLLPQLSVYMGHLSIVHTQRYLTVTPELLQRACERFESYAKMEVKHGKN